MKWNQLDPYHKIGNRDEYFKQWFESLYIPRHFINNEQLLKNHIMFAEDIAYIHIYLDMGYCVLVKSKKDNTFLCISNKLTSIYIDIDMISICNKQDRYNYFKFNRNRQIQHNLNTVHEYVNLSTYKNYENY